MITLSNAIIPKKVKTTTQPVSTVTSDQNDKALQETELNLPNFDLEQINDFSTIDNEELAKLMYEVPNDQTDKNEKENTMTLATKPQTVTGYNPINQQQIQVNPPQINTQVNTINNTPSMPYLYFPNSNVTINYNLGK